MARTNKDDNTAYNKAYYDAHKDDKEWMRKRSNKAAKTNARRQYDKRVAEWAVITCSVVDELLRGKTKEQVAEDLAKRLKVSRAKKNKWIDFSSSKSLSSSLPSARPARTQEGEEQAHSPRFSKENARAKCVKCGAVIESKGLHDYRCCDCGAISVDGGAVCPRLIGNYADFDQEFWKNKKV